MSYPAFSFQLILFFIYLNFCTSNSYYDYVKSPLIQRHRRFHNYKQNLSSKTTTTVINIGNNASNALEQISIITLQPSNTTNIHSTKLQPPRTMNESENVMNEKTDKVNEDMTFSFANFQQLQNKYNLLLDEKKVLLHMFRRVLAHQRNRKGSVKAVISSTHCDSELFRLLLAQEVQRSNIHLISKLRDVHNQNVVLRSKLFYSRKSDLL